MSRPTHIMLDLETWGTAPGSHLRSIGAVEFDPVGGMMGKEFYVNVDPQPTYGLTSDAATVQWWSEQSEEAQAALKVRQVDLLIALTRFSAWLAELQPVSAEIRLWGHGPTFDVSLLDGAYRAAGLEIPWHYRSPRDTRTIFEAAGGIEIPAHGTYHNALDDAKNQALAVIEAYRRINQQIPETEAIQLLRFQFDQRVGDLLEANNREVERRRAAERMLASVPATPEELRDRCWNWLRRHEASPVSGPTATAMTQMFVMLWELASIATPGDHNGPSRERMYALNHNMAGETARRAREIFAPQETSNAA